MGTTLSDLEINTGDKPVFAVYGNCQSQVIARYLLSCPEFSQRWDCLNIPGMQDMTLEQLSAFKAKVPALSLLIYQNVKRGAFTTSEILPLLPSGAVQVKIPSLFFNGYNPEVAYLRQSRATLFYHDRLMLQAIDSFDLFQKRLLEDQSYFPESFSRDCIDASLEELTMRERGLDTNVTISDYIANSYKTKRLFHVLNHPSAVLVREVATRVLRYLGIDGEVTEKVPLGPLDRWQFPIYRSHHLNLGLEFENPPEYLWAGQKYSVSEFFDFRKDQYSSLDLDLAREDTFAFSKPTIRGWDLAGELQFGA